METKTKISILTIFILLFVGFQNCSPSESPVHFQSGSNSLLDSGTPYEGKVYATTGRLCSDGSEIHSRIVLMNSDQAELNRENCQDIAPQQLAVSEYQIDAATDTLTYKNQSFKFIGLGSSGISNLTINSDATNFYYGYAYEGQPSWRQVFLDVDNNPSTGFYHHGIGADYMIENDYVWIYSAAANAPQNTWAWSMHVSSNKIEVAPNIGWSFARTAIGSPAIIKLIAQTSLGARTDIITQVPK